MTEREPKSDVRPPGSEAVPRRGFLRLVIGAGAAIIGAITLIPGVGYLLAPALSRGQRRRARVIFSNPVDARATTFVSARYEGEPETAPGLFVQMREGKPFVLWARCTHASCPVNWDANQNQFVCPCHGGRYDTEGRNISGPPPRPLERLAAEIVNGQVYVEEPEV